MSAGIEPVASRVFDFIMMAIAVTVITAPVWLLAVLVISYNFFQVPSWPASCDIARLSWVNTACR